MEAWLFHTLRLFSRLLRRGAEFLERQGQRIEKAAESNPGEDTPDPVSDPSRSPGEPPVHWLQKIEGREDPVQWIHHTEGDSTRSPYDRFAPRPSRPAAGSSGDEEFSPREPASERDEDRREDTIRHISQSINTDDPNRTRAPHRDNLSHRSRETASESYRAHPSGRRTDRDDPSSSPSKMQDRHTSHTRGVSARMRLQPAPPGTGRPGDDEIEQEASKHSESGTPENPEAPSLNYPPAPPELESPRGNSAKDELRRPSTPLTSSRTSISSQTVDESKYEIEQRSFPERSPNDRSSTSERVDPSPGSVFERTISRDDQWPPAASSSSRKEPGSRKFPPHEPRASSRNEEDSRDTSTETAKHPAPVSRPYESRWPELPDAAQILEENAPTARRWARTRDRERRKRLDREHRGRLWNE